MPELDRRRDKEKKRKRRRSDSFDEDEGGLSGWKIGIIFGVIIVCFAMLYPSVFHPIVMGFFGSKESKPQAQNRPPVHPAMGGAGMPRHGSPGGARGGEHPATRMAAAQAEGQAGGGKGMFTWMLPIYTIGVVIFLLYTLFKGKKKNKKRRNRYDSDESEDEEEYSKFSGKGVPGRKKLKELQSRLQQTEEAMSKILEQIQAVQAEGTLLQDDQEIPELQPSTSGTDPADPKTDLSEESKKYLGDLEGALQDFKVLSDAYEVEKNRHLKEMSSESEETSDSESDGERRRRIHDRKTRRKRKSESSEISEELSEEEEEGLDLENEPEPQVKESVIETKKPKESKARRRAKRVD